MALFAVLQLLRVGDLWLVLRAALTVAFLVAVFWLATPWLRPLGNVALGFIFIAVAFEVLKVSVEQVISGVPGVFGPLRMNAQGWAYWFPIYLLVVAGSGSYLIFEKGCRYLLSVIGQVGETMRAGAHRIVPPCCTGKIWMIAGGITLLPIAFAARWMIVAQRGYAPIQQGTLTLWLVIVAVLIGALLYFLGVLGRLNGGGAILGFRLLLWYGLMKGGFIAAAGFALALLAVAMNRVEIPPFGLVPLAVFLVCWWLGRNRFENAVGWWEYADEDQSFAG
jgi:hypothetical protein